LVCAADLRPAARANTQVFFPQVAKIQKFSNIFKRFALFFKNFQTFFTPTCVFGRAFCLPKLPNPYKPTPQNFAGTFSQEQPHLKSWPARNPLIPHSLQT